MTVANLTIEHFFGLIIFLPFLIFYGVVMLDGIGIFRDVFFTTNRRRR